MPTLAPTPTVSPPTSARPSKASPAPAGRTPAGPVRPNPFVCVSSSDIAVLANPRAPSGYHGVTLRTGADRRATPWIACYGYTRARPWRAAGGPDDTGRRWVRPKTYHRSAREAAAHIAAFWRGRHGDNWPAVYRARAAHPWEVKRSARHGFVLWVWVRGVRTPVKMHKDKAALKAFFRRWRVKEHGPNWRAVLWRQARGGVA